MANVAIGLGATGQPEMQEKGVIAAAYEISVSATTSLSDVLQIGKLPHGAIPVDVVFYPGAALGAAGGLVKFGYSASVSAFIGEVSMSYAAGSVFRGNRSLAGVQVSLSDDSGVRYDYVTMVPTEKALSVGYFGRLVVFYRMPGQTA